MNAQPDFVFSELAPERPRVVTTESHDEFMSLCARQDRGELVIESLSVGKTPATWIAVVRWKPILGEPGNYQQDQSQSWEWNKPP
jgi:hypothetical protein